MKKIYLIDWNSFIYRMFFALPEFTLKSGKIVNATFGMAKFFVNQLVNEKPDYLVFIKDAKWTNFRHELYADYKATRDRMPDNLRAQISDIEEMIALMNIEIVEISWYEADDVIATLAAKFDWNSDFELDILTWDKDLYSLVSPNIKIYDTMKKKKSWPEETREKFGIDAKNVIDYLAIVWDKADNIPGIEWFWPAKAVDLINIIWTVEEIYDFVDKFDLQNITEKQIKEILDKDFSEQESKKLFSIFKWKTLEKLLLSRENAFLSKSLASLEKNVSFDFDLEKFKFNPADILNPKLMDFFREFEFNSLINEQKTLRKWDDLWLKVQIIGDKQWLDDLSAKIEKYDEIIFDTETTALDIIKAELVWISIYLDDEHIFYINRLHNGQKVDDNDLKDFLNNLFSSDKLLIAHNLKYDLEIIKLFLNTNKELVKNKQNILAFF